MRSAGGSTDMLREAESDGDAHARGGGATLPVRYRVPVQYGLHTTVHGPRACCTLDSVRIVHCGLACDPRHSSTPWRYASKLHRRTHWYTSFCRCASRACNKPSMCMYVCVVIMRNFKSACSNLRVLCDQLRLASWFGPAGRLSTEGRMSSPDPTTSCQLCSFQEPFTPPQQLPNHGALRSVASRQPAHCPAASVRVAHGAA